MCIHINRRANRQIENYIPNKTIRGLRGQLDVSDTPEERQTDYETIDTHQIAEQKLQPTACLYIKEAEKLKFIQ